MHRPATDGLRLGDRVIFLGGELQCGGVVTDVLRHGFVRVRWEDLDQEIIHHSRSLARFVVSNGHPVT